MFHKTVAFVITFGTLLAAIFAAGCTSMNPAQVVGDDPQAGTYYQDIAPLLSQKCTTCHTAGGIAPFALETYADTASHAAEIAVAVSSGSMPPMPPEQTHCRPLDDDRNMTDDQRNLLVSWARNGTPEGDASNPAPLIKPADLMGPPTMNIDSGVDFTSTFDGSDEYRCFVIDPKLAGTFNLVAADTTSTNRAIVHHVIVYAALPASVSSVAALDAADPQPGYQCFGGPGFAGAIPVSASAVGSRTRPFPNGDGIPLPAGTQFVVQVHYNYDNGRGSNRLALQLWQSAGPITEIPHGLSVSNNTFFIPAGAPDVSATGVGYITANGVGGTKPGRIWEIFPHMHQLGKSIYVELDHADGTQECLLDIDNKWDFHWQGSYLLASPVTVKAGDQVKITCTWDNSATHQPLVNGVPQQPHDVHFGEGSTDEMCLTGVTLTN
jgi:hypothetical protein